ncbi:hypothetical protein K490DRAFT_34171 [Saccharata proteae CBS 121410]|uniref:AAA+ ATPase domain-containing protein n=1 Tax=Saccharata proteae CBS 121410 TaxID=1314787 RepID=A0A9P4I026_9PEZI|nr:hypothetical protein K490DRAFT_34171 [Saccharata proteae CBS 121410]
MVAKAAGKVEADRVSVNSIPTDISETTIAQDESIPALNQAKNQIRNKSPESRPQEQISSVEDAVGTFGVKLREELKSSNDEWLSAGCSIESFLDYIGSERLRRMPAKGSRWDKILKWAEYFATSLSLFEEAVDSFLASSKESVEIVFGCLRLLLQMGPNQGEAMEKAFFMFHEYGHVFAFYMRNYTILRSIAEARQELGLAMADMVGLSVEVVLVYRKSLRSIAAGTIVTIDFNVSFGRLMDSFVQHKDRITNLMWTFQLKNSSEITDIHVSIEEIRSWLLPQDRTLQNTLAGRRSARAVRAEYTCEWFERPLVDFLRSKDNVLTIGAETGSGKSVLFGWILERLQKPVGRRIYQPIQGSISDDSPTQATQTSLIKSLLLQLLEQNVGNVALYRCLANVLELDANTKNTEDAEDALWYVLETALKPCKDVVLVIDGLDALEGGESKKLEAFEKLYNTATNNKNVRVVVLTRPFSTPFPKPTRQIAMTPERTTEDVKHLTRSYLLSRGLSSSPEVDELAEQVAQRSKGSLTWGEMTLQLFQKNTTVTEMLETLKSVPETLKEVLDKHISSISLKGDARLIFSWMLVAKRPLTTVEIQSLLELQTGKGSHQPRSTNIIEDIEKACGPLVTIQDRTVRFRNESTRLHLLALSNEGKQLMSPAEAHRDMTNRLLLYNKVCVTRNSEPALDTLDAPTVDTLFRTSPLLEYSVRNWASHFKRSPYFAGGKLQPITPELKTVFPNSILLALLERSCWDKQSLMSRANQSHVLALQIRQGTLGENSRAVLQSSINVARSYEKLSAPVEASKYFYQAARLGQAVLGKSSDLAVACATACVNCTDHLKPSKRSEEVTRREEMLKYVVDTEKERNGPSSPLVARYNNQLAQLYTDVQENGKAENVYREIYQTTLEQSGEFSTEAKKASANLKAVLYKDANHEAVVQYTQPIFESAERTLEIFDVRRVEATLNMAETYEEKGDLIRAEELYITMWRGLAEYCRNNDAASEVHERKIQVTISYAKFLKTHGRQAEAENILHGVWVDYQHRENKTDALVSQLKAVGEELKAMGILETAVAVFKSIWGYMKGAGKQTSAEAVDTAVSLADAVQQKIAAATAAPAPTTSTSTSAAVAKEVADFRETAIQTCETLSVFYMSKSRWADAVNVLQKTLKQLWPILGVDGKFGFPKTYTDESIKLARRLAHCYAESNQTEQAEKVYLQLFQSARSGLRIQDALVAETASDLIEFYTRTKQFTKVLIIQQQLLESYRTALGSRNPLTIKTLYMMGDLCVKYRLRGADRYYLEVTNALKGPNGELSQESMRAALALSKIYYEQKRWEEARTVYSTVWVTFQTHAKEYGMRSDLVETIYKRYVNVLESHLNVDITVVRQVAIQYRDTCQKVYGADSQIATTASLHLAEVCKKSPEHQEEASQICEQVVAKLTESGDKVKTPAQLSILAAAKRHLASLHSSQANTGSAESQEKAVSLWKEQLEHSRKELGVSHKSTLAALSELVTVYSKSDKPELQAIAKQQLQSTAVEILSTQSESNKLHDAAISLAKTHLACKYNEQAWALLKDLRLQIISKEARKSGKHSITLPESVDRRALVFVAAFEETLRSAESKKVSFSDVMTDLLTESILYDRYNLSITSKDVKLEQKLFDGARLYVFLKTKEGQSKEALAIEDTLFNIFIKSAGASIKTSAEVTRSFFIALLEELNKRTHHEDLALAGLPAGVHRVHVLIEAEHFSQAFELATCLYQFISSREGFNNPKNIASSFKLSLYLAGLGVKKSGDEALQNKMVELSKAILRDTLSACKTLDIDLVQLQATELNNLVRLMGEQKNYEDLEWLLTQLWNSRQLQASWSATTVISVGRRLVEVLFTRNKQPAAIALCESIVYNLRRTWGLLDQVTIDLCNLLSTLYVAAGRLTDAMALHEEILRTEISEDSEDQMAEDIAADLTLQQLEHMKRIYARQGGWSENDDAEEYSDLVARIIEDFGDQFANVEGVEKWSTKAPAASDRFGTFVPPESWEFVAIQQAKKPDYLLRWLQLNRQMSFGDLAGAASQDAAKVNSSGVNGERLVNGA